MSRIVLERIIPIYDDAARPVATDIEMAQSAADDAQTAADNAQDSANAAQSAADDAQATANTAQTAANNAQTTANNAQTAANNAQTAANNAMTAANGKSKVIHQNDQPTGNNWAVGDTWFDANDGYAMYKWDGLGWVLEQLGSNAIVAGAIKASHIDAGAVTSDKIAANAVTANKINAGAVTADKIAANAVTADKIQAGSITTQKIHTDGLNASVIKAGKVQGAQNQATFFDLDNAEFVTQADDSDYGVYIHEGQVEAYGPNVDFTLYMDEDMKKTFLYSEEGVAIGDGLELYNNYNKHPYIDFHCDEYTTDSIVDYTTRLIETEPGLLRCQTPDGQMWLRNGNLELIYSTPFIDFHYNNTSNDFSTRIIANANNQIDVNHNDGSKTRFTSGEIDMFASNGAALYFHYNKATNATARIEESTSGTLKAYNSISNGSDQALKTDILPIDASYLELIDNLNPVEFRFKSNLEHKHLGFIAQDVDEALDEIGVEDKPLVLPPVNEDDYYALDYNQIIPLLVMYCQDLRREINELKSRLGE